jgi:hypothetical protein
VLNGSGILANSQCSISGAGTSVSKNGGEIRLKLAISFSQTGFHGDKVVYVAARDIVGNNSGWHTLGVWRVPSATPQFPAIVSLAPNTGGGSGFSFLITYQDSAAATNSTAAQLLINDALDGRHACYVGYDRANNRLYLVNDAGNALLPPVVPNSSTGTTENSQCRINGYYTFVRATGIDLALTVNISFKSGFSGRKILYGGVQTVSGGNSGWHAVGVWNVP